MRITQLELKGYKRLLLSTIDHLVYRPESTLQIIIGTNGCGKSSLLFELSPLPASPSDYDKGGYKKIHIEHNGIEYILSSTFNTVNSHSFLKGEVELNPGKTSQYQKELVEIEFGWTKEVHDLMLGIDKFTLMSPSKRRDWLFQLSKINYDYINGLYHRLASTQRDLQGSNKHIEQRLSEEQKNLGAIENDEELLDSTRALRDDLNAMMRISQHGAKPLIDLKSDFEALIDLSTQILDVDIPEQIPDSYNALISQRLICREKLNTLSTMLNRISKEYVDLENQSSLFETEDFRMDVDQLIVDNRSRIINYKPGLFTIEQPLEAYEAAIDLQTNWHDIFSSLPDNNDGWYSKEQYTLLQNQLKHLKDQSDQISLKLSILNNKKKTLESIEFTDCPACGHSWKIGYHQEDIDVLENQLDHLTKQGVEIDSKLKDTKEQIETLEHAQSLYLRLAALAQANPLLKSLWDHVLSNRLHFKSPQSSLGLLQTWIKECRATIEYRDAKKNLEHYLKIKENKENGLYRIYCDKKKALSEEIESITEQIASIKQEMRLLESTITVIDKLIRQGEDLNRLYESILDKIKESYIASANLEIEKQIHVHQLKLSHNQTALSQLTTLQGIVNDLVKSRDKLKDDLNSATLLTQTLSPVSGLIAEEINRFIEYVVEQLNSVVCSIWAYDLKVLPCQLEQTGDLNYRFALDHGLGQPVSDISKGSQAQQDVVNFAFVLLVMMFKGLDNVPLFLDELGSSFDEQHRLNLMNFIKHLVDSGRFSQVYLISHYASQYAMMSSADVLVLDQKNVAVPQHYNHHVSFHSALS